MTTIQIDEEQSKVQEFLDLAVKKFNFNIRVLDSTNTKSQKGKWGKFADEIDGIFTPNIVNHIKKSKNEARENFVTNT